MSELLTELTPEQAAALVKYKEKLKTALFIGMTADRALELFQEINQYRAKKVRDPKELEAYEIIERSMLRQFGRP